MSERTVTQNFVYLAQRIARTAWEIRISEPVAAFNQWALANDLLKLAKAATAQD